MKRMMSVMVLTLAVMFIHATPALADEPYLGQVELFAGTYPPPGYKFCEGQLLKVKNNAALHGILGHRYGGDGKETFALPNMSEAEKALDGVRYIIAVEGIFPERR